jgi:predicted nucleotidyltransferase
MTLETIKEQIKKLEEEQQIRVLYSCESGSRAWGFASPDSDFDVRFIYARKQSDYLKITDSIDVIELPINDLLDMGGWDIKKALKLFLKSNSPLYEWLQSPIVYQDNSGFAKELQRLMQQYYSLKAGANHYASITFNTLTNDLQNEQAKLKRYFYALRSALACKWIVEKQTVPPMEFGSLRVLIDNPRVEDEIEHLLKLKVISDEKTFIKPNDVINEWLTNVLSDCKDAIDNLPSNHKSTDELDAIFRRYIS